MAPNSPSFRPGHSLHQIQTRKAFEDRGSWQTVTLLHAGEGKIAGRSSDGATLWYECGDFPRFLAAIHLVPGLIAEPRQLMLASRWRVLMVPPGGARSMTDAGVEGVLAVFELRGGSVVAALTKHPGGKVPLFSIAPSNAVEGVEFPPAEKESSDAGGAADKRSKTKVVWYVHVKRRMKYVDPGHWFFQSDGDLFLGQATPNNDGTWHVYARDFECTTATIDEAKEMVAQHFDSRVEDVPASAINHPPD